MVVFHTQIRKQDFDLAIIAENDKTLSKLLLAPKRRLRQLIRKGDLQKATRIVFLVSGGQHNQTEGNLWWNNQQSITYLF